MFELLSKFYGGLPEGAKQVPAAAMLMVAITTYISGTWISGKGCQALRDADQGTVTELRSELASKTEEALLYRNTLLKGIVSTEDTAKKAIATIEQTAPSTKPATARVVVKTLPISATEKAAVEKPPQATDPATLERRQSTAIDVVKKVVPTVQSVKKL